MSWQLGSIDFETYGVKVSRSQGVLDLPASALEGTDWLDQDGIDYWEAEQKYNDREIVLNCWMMAAAAGADSGYTVFQNKVKTFTDALKLEGWTNLVTPYNTIPDCAITSGVTIIRETNYVDVEQVGTFSLRITVKGDEKWRAVPVYDAAPPWGIKDYMLTNNLQVNRTLQGDSYATCSIETRYLLDFEMYDYIKINTNGLNEEPYYLMHKPDVQKNSTNKFRYNLRFEHGSVLLEQAQFQFEGEAEFEIFADLTTIVDLIVTNISRFVANKFFKGDIASTIRKNHNFKGEDCLAVAKRLAQEYGLELDIKYVTPGAYYTINIVEQIATTKAITLEYGKGKGLYELSRQPINRDSLVTVLYAYGAAKNLKPDYRGGKRRLEFDGNPLRQNDMLYMGVEKTVFFDDIYPNRTATVTGYYQKLPAELNDQEREVWPGGIYRVTDLSLEFDINNYLLGGLTAKIRMKTGNLAGYEFEIQKYDHATAELFIIPFKDEKGYVVPNATLQIGIGDEYTLVDIDQPASYVAVAEAELLARSQEYLDKWSVPEYPYNARVHPAFLADIAARFEVGDRITVIDTDFGINRLYRISQFTYHLYTGVYELTLSEHRIFNRRERLQIAIEKLERTIEATNADKVEVIRKEKETATELKNRLLDPSDDRFAADRIVRLKSLDPGMLALDASTIQWSIKDALVDCNVDGDYDKVKIGAGTLTYHNWATKDRYNIAKEKQTFAGYHPERTWNIEATEFNLLSPSAHWMYAKLDLTDGSTACTILLSEEHIEGKYQIENNYLHLKLGDITSSASPRFASMIWGNVRYATIQHVHDMIEENNQATAQASGDIIYLHGNASDLVDYRKALTDLPDDVEGTATAEADSTGGEVLIDEFSTDPGKPGVTIIPAGTWIFETWCKVDLLAGINTLKIVAYKRDLLGVETALFNVSTEITSIDVLLHKIATEQPDIVLAATDRLVFKYYFSTTSYLARTATLYFEGAENYSRIRSTIKPPVAAGIPGVDGREVELSTDGGYIVWRYVGETVWNNLLSIASITGDAGVSTYTYVAYASDNAGTGFSLTPTDLLKYRAEIHVTSPLSPPVAGNFAGATWVKYLGDDGAGGGGDTFVVHLKFEEAGAIVYTAPYACKFTAMKHSQANAPTLSVPLNTSLAEYNNLTVTVDTTGLVTLTGIWL